MTTEYTPVSGVEYFLVQINIMCMRFEMTPDICKKKSSQNRFYLNSKIAKIESDRENQI